MNYHKESSSAGRKMRQEGNSIPCYCKNDKHTSYHASIRTQQSTRKDTHQGGLDDPDDIVEIWNCLFLYHIFACKYTLMMAVPSCYNIKELTKLSRQMKEEPAPTTMLYWVFGNDLRIAKGIKLSFRMVEMEKWYLYMYLNDHHRCCNKSSQRTGACNMCTGLSVHL